MIGPFPEPDQDKVHRNGEFGRGGRIGLIESAIDIAFFQDRPFIHPDDTPDNARVISNSDGLANRIHIRRYPTCELLA